MTLDELKLIKRALYHNINPTTSSALKLIQREIDRKEINPVTNLPYKKDQDDKNT